MNEDPECNAPLLEKTTLRTLVIPPRQNMRPWQKPKKMETGNQDEAPKDPGALTSHPSYTDKDFEGHRAHTVYVGLHVPGYHRRGHRRHHRHHHKNGHAAKKDGTGAAGDGNHRSVTPPAERVHFILGEEEDGLHEAHPLFSEMEILCAEGEEMEWREAARWIKFEEDVEEGGDRWSKPHVSTISLHALMELRSFILNSTVMLDMEATSLENIADLVLENMVNGGQLSAGEQLERVKEVLLRRHRHQHERHRTDKGSRLPLIRSLADIGRNSSKSMFGTHNHGEKGSSPSLNPDPTSVAISAAPCGQGNGRNDWWWMPKFLRDQLCALPGKGGPNAGGASSPSSFVGVPCLSSFFFCQWHLEDAPGWPLLHTETSLTPASPRLTEKECVSAVKDASAFSPFCVGLDVARVGEELECGREKGVCRDWW